MNDTYNIDDIVRGFIVKDGKIMYVTNILNGCRQEFKDIHEICDELNNSMKEIDRLMEQNNYLRFQLEECKKLTVKEFAEKLKKKLFDFFQDNEEIDGKISTGVLYSDIIGVDTEDGTIITLGLIDAILKEYEK